MQAFTVLIDRRTREELYSDIAPEFLSVVMMEAIMLIVKNQLHADPEPVEVIDGLQYCDDPEGDFDNSAIYLLDVLAEHDKAAGLIDVSAIYEYNSEYHQQICYKLNEAMESIESANQQLDLMMIRQLLESPEYAASINFKAHHLVDRVMFFVSPGAPVAMSTFTLPTL